MSTGRFRLVLVPVGPRDQEGAGPQGHECFDRFVLRMALTDGTRDAGAAQNGKGVVDVVIMVVGDDGFHIEDGIVGLACAPADTCSPSCGPRAARLAFNPKI